MRAVSDDCLVASSAAMTVRISTSHWSKAGLCAGRAAGERQRKPPTTLTRSMGPAGGGWSCSCVSPDSVESESESESETEIESDSAKASLGGSIRVLLGLGAVRL